MEALEPLHDGVDRALQLGRDGLLGVLELGRSDDETALAQVGAVEAEREVEDGCIAVGAHAREDLAHGPLHGGVDLEASGLEPLPPVPEVEELEHLVLLGGLVLGWAGRPARRSRTKRTQPLTATNAAATKRRARASRNVAWRSMGPPGYPNRRSAATAGLDGAAQATSGWMTSPRAAPPRTIHAEFNRNGREGRPATTAMSAVGTSTIAPSELPRHAGHQAESGDVHPSRTSPVQVCRRAARTSGRSAATNRNAGRKMPTVARIAPGNPGEHVPDERRRGEHRSWCHLADRDRVEECCCVSHPRCTTRSLLMKASSTYPLPKTTDPNFRNRRKSLPSCTCDASAAPSTSGRSAEGTNGTTDRPPRRMRPAARMARTTTAMRTG